MISAAWRRRRRTRRRCRRATRRALRRTEDAEGRRAIGEHARSDSMTWRNARRHGIDWGGARAPPRASVSTHSNAPTLAPTCCDADAATAPFSIGLVTTARSSLTRAYSATELPTANSAQSTSDALLRTAGPAQPPTQMRRSKSSISRWDALTSEASHARIATEISARRTKHRARSGGGCAPDAGGDDGTSSRSFAHSDASVMTGEGVWGGDAARAASPRPRVRPDACGAPSTFRGDKKQQRSADGTSRAAPRGARRETKVTT